MGANRFLSRVKEAAKHIVSQASPGHLTRLLPLEMPCSESTRRHKERGRGKRRCGVKEESVGKRINGKEKH